MAGEATSRYLFLTRNIVLRKLKILGIVNGKVKYFFSHGSEHSRGTMIMIRNCLEFELTYMYLIKQVKLHKKNLFVRLTKVVLFCWRR